MQVRRLFVSWLFKTILFSLMPQPNRNHPVRFILMLSCCLLLLACPVIMKALAAGYVHQVLGDITFDTSGKQQESATCGLDNGAITGIVVNNATNYQWYRIDHPASPIPVSDQLDLTGAAPGYYMLEASNTNTG